MSSDTFPEGYAEILLREIGHLPEDDPRRDAARAELVQMFTPVARHIARRYSHRGEPLEDIEQAALVGLVKAINRFDPEIADRFLAYASPMMTGEVKRHFRDRTWALHVPRRLQELRISLRQASREFAQEHSRPATVPEIAKMMEITEEEAVEVIGASDAYRPASLDAPVTDQDGSESLGDLIGGEDRGLQMVIDTEALRPVIDDLPDRERRIVLLRFFGNKTQSQIAEDVGISQMHVSRLISRSLDQMRSALLADA
jgi:RNA polymerase sigma-B factor